MKACNAARGSPDGYGLHAALIFEIVFTAIFVIVILGVTRAKGEVPFAGLAIGAVIGAAWFRLQLVEPQA